MGDLVMFRPASRAPRLEAPQGSQGAEIVFFTGVRYERCAPTSNAEAQPPPPEGGFNGTGRRKRKRRA
jgi:hypothetical protein